MRVPTHGACAMCVWAGVEVRPLPIVPTTAVVSLPQSTDKKRIKLYESSRCAFRTTDSIRRHTFAGFGGIRVAEACFRTENFERALVPAKKIDSLGYIHAAAFC